MTESHEIEEVHEVEVAQEVSRSSKHKHRRKSDKPRKKRGCFTWMLIGLLAIILGFGVYVWTVWSSVETTVEKIQMPRPKEQVQIREKAVDVAQQEPFSVLLLGVDTGELGRTEKGRSDTMVVVTVNPNTDTVTLTSIPRDTYTEIVGRGTQDKINHAYAFGGLAMAVNSVQNLLDIPIDYTVSADMAGFEEIVEAVGGIDVVPPVSFIQSGVKFEAGVPKHLNGKEALAYARNRKSSGGDYGRQGRARDVVQGIIKSAADLDSLVNYQSVLSSLSNHITTDMSYDEMMSIMTKYQSAIKHFKEYQLQGESQKIDGVYYEIINEASLSTIQSNLKAELELTDDVSTIEENTFDAEASTVEENDMLGTESTMERRQTTLEVEPDRSQGIRL